jgi:DNA modification methylase
MAMTSPPRNAILHGDALTILRTLPSGCVQTVVTSPPYWGLRDYGAPGQLGLEPTLADYLTHMVEVFAEVKRVLRKDGCAWVNMGDSYAGAMMTGGTNGINGSDRSREKMITRPARIPRGLKPKDLCGVPWRLAFALQDDGWYLRSDIIWAKPNPMPESVTDRPTRSHEYIFLLTKSPRYYYDAEAIRESPSQNSHGGNPLMTRALQNPAIKALQLQSAQASTLGLSARQRTDKQRGHGRRHAGFNDRWDLMSKEEQQALGANKRDVWTVATHPFPDAHFATFPPKLIEPCILAGSSPQACETCGAPWTRETVNDVTYEEAKKRATARRGSGIRSNSLATLGLTSGTGNPSISRITHTLGWRPTCRCPQNTGAARCLILDPFMGAGTTAIVAVKHLRDYLGIELQPDYIAIANKRLAHVQTSFASLLTEEEAAI